MNLYISGASHSGKTTYIHKLKNILEDYAILHTQIVRQKTFNSIDELRKNPEQYLDFQYEVVIPKMTQEVEAIQDDKNVIHIFDRSIVDSLFYVTNYVDKSMLSSQYKKKYIELVDMMIKHLQYIRTCNNQYMVFMFSPIEFEQHNDLYRPVDLKLTQSIEYQLIQTMTSAFLPHVKTYNVMNTCADYYILQQLISFMLIKSNIDLQWEHPLYCDLVRRLSYKAYSVTVQKLFLQIYNRYTNIYGSISIPEQYENEYWDDIQPRLFFPGLFTNDKLFADEIINSIKQINISPEYMNSRCYPTGILKKNNIMIVGQAPGVKGRSVIENGLKPSFIYTKTSHILRMAIWKSIQSDNNIVSPWVPYITNLLKYAMPNNKVSQNDFDACYDIFIKQVEYIQPPMIIALGRTTYDYLKRHLNDKYNVIYFTHPASVLYGGISEEEYVNKFKQLFE